MKRVCCLFISIIAGWIVMAAMTFFLFAVMMALSGCSPAQEVPRSKLYAPTFRIAPTFAEFAVGESVFVTEGDDFSSALASNTRVIVAAGDYTIGRTDIPSNIIIELQPGVTLRDSGRLGPVDQLLNIKGENVKIIGHGARVISRRSDYTSGEFRHGVFIYGASNVMIEGLESSAHGGDGFYIGGPKLRPSHDIVIKGCAADNNRRQGVSIVSAQRLYIADCELSNTKGTAPSAGIDIEPNNDFDVIQDVGIVRPRTLGNDGGGVIVFLKAFSKAAKPVDVAILERFHVGKGKALRLEFIRDIDRVFYE